MEPERQLRLHLTDRDLYRQPRYVEIKVTPKDSPNNGFTVHGLHRRHDRAERDDQPGFRPGLIRRLLADQFHGHVQRARHRFHRQRHLVHGQHRRHRRDGGRPERHGDRWPDRLQRGGHGDGDARECRRVDPGRRSQDAATNGNTASTSTDNTVTWDRARPHAPTFSPASPKTNDSLTASPRRAIPTVTTSPSPGPGRSIGAETSAPSRRTRAGPAPAGARTASLDLSQNYADELHGTMINPLNPSKGDPRRRGNAERRPLRAGHAAESYRHDRQHGADDPQPAGTPNEGETKTYTYNYPRMQTGTRRPPSPSKCGTAARTTPRTQTPRWHVRLLVRRRPRRHGRCEGDGRLGRLEQAADLGIRENVAPTIAISGGERERGLGLHIDAGRGQPTRARTPSPATSSTGATRTRATPTVRAVGVRVAVAPVDDVAGDGVGARVADRAQGQGVERALADVARRPADRDRRSDVAHRYGERRLVRGIRAVRHLHSDRRRRRAIGEQAVERATRDRRRADERAAGAALRIRGGEGQRVAVVVRGRERVRLRLALVRRYRRADDADRRRRVGDRDGSGLGTSPFRRPSFGVAWTTTESPLLGLSGFIMVPCSSSGRSSRSGRARRYAAGRGRRCSSSSGSCRVAGAIDLPDPGDRNVIAVRIAGRRRGGQEVIRLGEDGLNVGTVVIGHAVPHHAVVRRRGRGIRVGGRVLGAPGRDRRDDGAALGHAAHRDVIGRAVVRRDLGHRCYQRAAGRAPGERDVSAREACDGLVEGRREVDRCDVRRLALGGAWLIVTVGAAASTLKMLNVAVCVLSLASVSFQVPWFEAEKSAQFGAS